MHSFHTIGLCLLCGASSAAFARPARACSPITVEADTAVLRRWPELPERIRSTFTARDGIDPCAEVRLHLMPLAVLVEVFLPDGRSASRSVPHGDDVVPLLEALLLVPPEATPASLTEASVPAVPIASSDAAPVVAASRRVRARAPTWRAPTVAERDVTERSPEPSEDGLGLELSALAGAHIGEDSQTSVGLGVLSFCNLSGWLVGFEGRADHHMVTSSESQTTLQLAALGGRRFEFQSVALDLIGGPAVALQGGSTTQTAGPAGTYREEIRPGVLPRLHLASHLHFAAHSVLRGFVGITANLAPEAAHPMTACQAVQRGCRSGWWASPSVPRWEPDDP